MVIAVKRFYVVYLVQPARFVNHQNSGGAEFEKNVTVVPTKNHTCLLIKNPFFMNAQHNEFPIVDFEKVTIDNVDMVKSVARAIWQVTYKDIISQQQMDYMLDNMYSTDKIMQEIEKGFQWEVASIDQDIVGYLDYIMEQDQRVFLSKIYLRPEVQKKGIGQILLNRVIDFSKRNGGLAVYLTVNKDNTKAISFYERNGFVTVDAVVAEIGNGYVMDDYIMQLDL